MFISQMWNVQNFKVHFLSQIWPMFKSQMWNVPNFKILILSQIWLMFVSQMWNVPNVELIFFRIVTSQNRQKRSALNCYHFENLEGHTVRALFEQPNPHFCRFEISQMSQQLFWKDNQPSFENFHHNMWLRIRGSTTSTPMKSLVFQGITTHGL